MFYGLLKVVILGPILRLLFRPWAKGLENIPGDGPVILASNHLSFSDSFFMPLMVPRPVFFLAKSDYFTGKGIKGRLTAAFFRGVRSVPIDRSSGAAADPALKTALRILSEGKALGLYPEGTRSPDGRLYKGRTGIARIALESGVPVVPCAMVGTFELQPPGQVMPKIMRVGVRFGEPLDFSRYRDMPDASHDRYILRSITDEIMYALMDLSGQEYVDMYATDAKKIIAAEKAAERAVEKAEEARAAAEERKAAIEERRRAEAEEERRAALAAEEEGEADEASGAAEVAGTGEPGAAVDEPVAAEPGEAEPGAEPAEAAESVAGREPASKSAEPDADPAETGTPDADTPDADTSGTSGTPDPEDPKGT